MTVRVYSADATDSNVVELLYLAVGGARSRLTPVVQHYRDNDAAFLLSATTAHCLIGIVGYELHADRIILLHIATHTSARRRGTGRRLLREISTRHPGHAVVAETDCHAVRFYRAVGFEVASLGEKYPGVERFEVHWPAVNPAAS
ncbi:MAG: GNAT family N-acetyltransferase [Nocardia sp.]|nr:GNAT family N-acetyltransferase [Nocardia sp.]